MYTYKSPIYYMYSLIDISLSYLLIFYRIIGLIPVLEKEDSRKFYAKSEMIDVFNILHIVHNVS